MTIEEAIYCMTSYLPDNEIEHCLSCPYYGTKKEGFMKLCRSSEAHQMAADILRIYASHMNESTADADIVYRRDVLDTINANAITPIAIDMRLDELIDEINKIPPVEMWISPEKAMPENNADALVLCEIRYLNQAPKRYVCIGVHIEEHTIEDFSLDGSLTEYDEETDTEYICEGWYERIHNWEDFSSVTIDDFVIGWQPLPPMYQEKNR